MDGDCSMAEDLLVSETQRLIMNSQLLDDISTHTEEPKTKRIVIIGKTGVGKSSLGNTIFDENVFQIIHSANSHTSTCQAKSKFVHERNITLIDTPGFFDTDRPEEELKPEIVKCIVESSPGPHAFLIVLQVGRFTEQEQDIVTEIEKTFSLEAFRYATVVFTHGDQLPEGTTIQEFVSQNTRLSDFVKKCGGRCHVIDNKYWNNNQDEYRNNQYQVKQLLNTLDETIEKNNGGFFTNESLQAVETDIQNEEESIRKKNAGNMSPEEIKANAKESVFKRYLINLAGIATGVLLGALLGVGVAALLTWMKMSAGMPFPITVGCTVVVGAVAGGVIGYSAAKGAETPKEAAGKAAKAVWKETKTLYSEAKAFRNEAKPASK